MTDLKPTERFSDRVDDYVKYRPSYPPELLDYLNQKQPLKNAEVADVGAGTGIFTTLLLDRGAHVHAVEPNAKMREPAESVLGARAKFYPGTAEATGLADHSMDLITCAQAFHWFDPEKTRREFQRILKPGHFVALIWNDVDKGTSFGAEYDKIKIEFGGKVYQDVLETENNLDSAMTALFGGDDYESPKFRFAQRLDLKALAGRYFSSSYAPKAGAPEWKIAEEALSNAFNKFNLNGCVDLEYSTELFLGKLI